MGNSSIVTITIGILGAIIGVYFRECFRQAKRQKIISTKLESYIYLMIKDFIKEPFLSFQVIGKKWSDRYKTYFKKYGDVGIEKAFNEIENEKKEITKLIKTANEEVKKAFEEDFLKLKDDGGKMINQILSEVTKYESLYLDNKIFISDEEAAQLPNSFAFQCITLKHEILTLLSSFQSLAIKYEKMERFDYDLISDTIIDLIIALLNITQKQFPMLKTAQRIKKTKTLNLTIKNMFS